MFALQTTQEVLTALRTSSEGLSESEASDRLRTYGFNELLQEKRSVILLFFRQFHDVMVYILFGALILSIAVPFWSGREIAFEGMLDAMVILAILLLNALFGFIQEYKAEEAITELSKLTAPHARVRRGGTECMIPSRELVPGDIVLIEAGDRVSSDGRIMTLAHLEVNESSITGESQPVAKSSAPLHEECLIAEQENMVFAGTMVTRGSAQYVVTATGLRTELGKLATLVSQTDVPETPLQMRMKTLGKFLGIMVVSLCIVVVSIGFVRGLAILDILLMGVSLAVSAVPEGLVTVVTVCLALGVRRMAKQNALVRRLAVLEALGSVTVICADKTGTITENRMKVVETWLPMERLEEQSLLARIGASCNRAILPDIGDPTELALLAFAAEHKIDRLNIDEEEVPFTSEEKYMQTRHGDRSFLKGAPEKIFALCGEMPDREAALRRNEDMTSRGLRVLATAVREGEKVRFVGLFGLEDPPRAGVDRAIAQAKGAGIRTIMITGDHMNTARAIAYQVGIEGGVLEGANIDHMDTQELSWQLEHVSVFARVSPLHKVAILDVLKNKGHIVAMSGDGVNDAPALKGAHVGIAMGQSGTDVAREAASMILADDQYVTIVNAIREGRRIYDNIRKFILFLLRSNFDEILFITVTIIVGLPLPYLPIHILWINLMTDGLPALALGLEPEEPGIMDRPPRPSHQHILSGQWWNLCFSVLWGAAVSFMLFFWQIRRGVPLEQARTAVLMLAVFFELFLVVAARSQRPIFSVGFFGNRWMIGAIIVPLLLQLLLFFTPLRSLFHLTALSSQEWFIVLALASSGFFVFEMIKIVCAWRDRRKE